MSTDTQYRIFIDDAKYSAWRIIDLSTNELTDPDFKYQPINYKLMNNDVVTYDKQTDKVKKLSSLAQTQILTGVLVVDKSYGKVFDKHYYRCIPHDKHLPEFIVTY